MQIIDGTLNKNINMKIARKHLTMAESNSSAAAAETVATSMSPMQDKSLS